METIQVPFVLPVVLIDELVTGMSWEMAVPIPERDSDKIQLFNDWVKHRAKQTIMGVRYAEASNLVDTSDVDAW